MPPNAPVSENLAGLAKAAEDEIKIDADEIKIDADVMNQLCNSADCQGLTCNSGAVACQTLTASVGAGNEERGAGCGFGAASPCAALGAA